MVNYKLYKRKKKTDSKTLSEYLKAEMGIARPFIEDRISKCRLEGNHFISARNTDDELIDQVAGWAGIQFNNRRWIIKTVFLENGLQKWSDSKSQTYYIP